ncbi:MAG: hypothetical protein J6H31_14350 [Butyrivibrio sp.]|nr:hypothetical protein [Butyrivibrio sp.]
MFILIFFKLCICRNNDWKLACNYMKLIAVSLTTKKAFIKENYNDMIDSLIRQIVNILCA